MGDARVQKQKDQASDDRTKCDARAAEGQRGRAAARRAALRERDAEHAAWCAANGVTPVRIVTRADGTVVETRGHVCGVGAPDKPFTPFNPGI